MHVLEEGDAVTPLEEALVRAAKAETRLAAIDRIYRSSPLVMEAEAASALLNAIGRIARDPA